jgi:hypothetical protein
MKHSLSIHFVFTLSFMIVWNAYSASLYISPAGSDTSDGSLKQPLRTIEKAQAAVRELKTRTAEDITVYLSGGMYYLTNTLKFSSDDSARYGQRIIWRNLPGEMPVLSGGREITGWKTQNASIVTAPVPHGMRFRHLTVNNKKAIRARFLYGTWARVRWDADRACFYLPTAEAARLGVDKLKQTSGVEMNLIETFNALQIKVTQIKTIAGNLCIYTTDDMTTMLLLKRGDKDVAFGHNKEKIFEYDVYFENDRDFLTDPGEWYHDENMDMLFYILRPGESALDLHAMVPAVETLIEMDGVENLVFFGLVFEHSSWTYPSDSGLKPLQNLYCTGPGDFKSNFPIPAAIQIRRSTRVQFERNCFRFTGGTGIMVWNDSTRYLSILGNIFQETSAAAIQLGNDDRTTNTEPTDGIYRPAVYENYFLDCGMQYSTPVVFCTFPYRLDFKNNTVKNSKAITLNVGWAADINSAAYFRPLIRMNVFDHCVQEATDAAVYHTRNDSGGGLIEENLFRNTIKVESGRILGRYTVLYNDPKFGNIYLDNDADNNYLVRNVHVNFRLCSNKGRFDNVVTYSGKQEQLSNFILPCENDNIEQKVESTAGVTENYRSMQVLYQSNLSGVSQEPSPHCYAGYIIDDRDAVDRKIPVDRFTLTYKGIWEKIPSGGIPYSAGGYLNTYTRSAENGASVTLQFTGSEVCIFGPLSPIATKVEISLDGVVSTMLDVYGETAFIKRWYEKKGLVYGKHTLTITWRGGGNLVIDGFEVR